MEANIQFSQGAESEQQKAARVLMRAPDASAEMYGDQADYARYRDTPVDNYLIGRNLIANAGEKQTWFQTTGGRIGTRLVSRGIFGALAFTWMQNYAGRAMRNYDPRSIESVSEWSRALFNPRVASRGGNGIADHINTPNTMQAVAKAFDVVAGEPIKFIARVAGGAKRGAVWADKAVLFRQRSMYSDPISTFKPGGGFRPRQVGRSLGAEVVAVTSDFAAASFGDAFARNVIDAADPNNEKARKAWNDKSGHFNVGNFAWDWTKRLWRVASFNMGEDWAVALPYVYFIKWHRNVIDRFSPGFKLASDNPSWQAASTKMVAIVDNKKVVGLEYDGTNGLKKDFQKEGAWDLHARFVIYNVFTLMFRETYTAIGNALMGLKDGKAPEVKLPANPITAAIEGAGDVTRYMAKSFIKANLYMQPAVVPFWVMRTSQSKWQASPIVVAAKDKRTGKYIKDFEPAIVTVEPATARGIHPNLLNTAYPSQWNDASREYYKLTADPIKNREEHHIGYRSNDDNKRYHPTFHLNYNGPVYVRNLRIDNHPLQGHKLYDDASTRTLFGALTKPLGRISYKSGTFINNIFQKNDGMKRIGSALFNVGYSGSDQTVRNNSLERSARTFVDASFSYTPYMITKAETALRWDNADMDRAAYRLIDGVNSFDIGEVKKAIAEIGDLLVHPRVRNENTLDANLNPIDSSLKPTTRIATGDVKHSAMVHTEHRTIQ